uniref:Uncharacterized protein n=1 Tax=Strix occidentalis caurina TaxID=311401 RepID=A0A8D0F864_STROC
SVSTSGASASPKPGTNKRFSLLRQTSRHLSIAKLFLGAGFLVFPVWPEFCGRTLSWPAEHCPGHRSRWNPVPTAAWSTSPPEAGRIYLSFFLQIHPPLAPALQPPP